MTDIKHDPTEVIEQAEAELYANVRSILAKARATVYVTANTAMVEAYWNVGREIVEKQGGAERAKYGARLVRSLAIRLTAEFGEGFTAANLFNMRQFYLAFPKFYTLCRELTWSHYRELMRVEDESARRYYMEECAKGHWGVRLLQRQIHTQFYERLIHNTISPDAMKMLVKRRSADVKDIIRSPAILEFAGINTPRYKEKDLESALIKNMRMFLMELGRGFCLEAEQKKLQIGGETYSCDLVFYNYIARCFFLIDLKVGKVTPQDIGQMQLYKHYYEREMTRPGDNPPVGIVLGSSADTAIVKYTLNEHERNLFAVKYHLHLPTVEELQLELRRERAAIEEALALHTSQLTDEDSRLVSISEIKSNSRPMGKSKPCKPARKSRKGGGK